MRKCVWTTAMMLCLAWALASAAQDQSSAAKQDAKPTHPHGPGKQMTKGISVPFTPGRVDNEGKVIPAVPDISKFEGEEEGPSWTEKGIADKAKAEAGAFRSLMKPQPRLVPPGKDYFLQRMPQGVAG